jgi:hypothetical protein
MGTEGIKIDSDLNTGKKSTCNAEVKAHRTSCEET